MSRASGNPDAALVTERLLPASARRVFAAFEQPDLFTNEIRKSFATLR